MGEKNITKPKEEISISSGGNKISFENGVPKTIDILKMESDISFEVILKDKDNPNFLKLTRLYGEHGACYPIYCLTKSFLINQYPDGQHDVTANVFAFDALRKYPDWSYLDIINFFKFIRTQRDIPELKIYGNSVNSMKLMEMAYVYEEHKSIEREALYRQNKAQDAFNRSNSINTQPIRIDATASIKRSQEGKINDAPDEKFFEKKD